MFIIKMILPLYYPVALPCSNEAMKAVARLIEHRRMAWLKGILPSAIHPKAIAIRAASRPSTVACNCEKSDSNEVKLC